MSSENDQLVWKAYAVKDTKKWSEFEIINFEPKTFDDYDIDIKINYCGVCGSDVHTITGGWGGNTILPLITGHEIIGTVHRVGPKVTEFHVGDRVGVGAQIWSCLECESCKADKEQYCAKAVDTYNDKYPNGDIAHGGYSTAIRAHERFTFPIPKELDSKMAAPLMCAGITVYSPLKANNVGKGKVVGIVGIGGLGHLAIQFAKAMGAKVIVFSHSPSKEKDARELGADEFVVTSDASFANQWERKIDVLLSTADVSSGFPLGDFFKVLAAEGTFVVVGIPDDKLPQFAAPGLVLKGAKLAGSKIGSKKGIIEMLELAAKHDVKAWIEELPMKECGTAVKDVKEGHVRYRHILKMDLE
ncbi:GroES-like protein [Crepidotus variabilis]|uniref:GroES-like protein n=1 Tax=Crepidotus variabilis TaxID=179855 RepID=A0A9P6E514_9AGAR|nr:GroES-like protein [Crepidotus variabilis]